MASVQELQLKLEELNQVILAAFHRELPPVEPEPPPVVNVPPSSESEHTSFFSDPFRWLKKKLFGG